MAEKIISPGVYTNEIDQSFLPATAGPIGAAIVGPTVKGPVLIPTVVSSYSEFVGLYGEIIESGSNKYQYLTSHTAKEYLRQGGPCTIVRVGDYDAARATANVDKRINTTGSADTVFTMEALGDGPQYNNFVGTGSSMGTDQILPVRANAAATNNHFGSGSFGGHSFNFRWEVSQRNLNKGTFTLLIRAGNDSIKKKQIIETHSNLSLDPESQDFILKRIGNTKNTIGVEGSQAFIQPVGEYPNRSKFVRISSLPVANQTPNYLDENGDRTTAYASSGSFFPPVGSGSFGGAFGVSKDISSSGPMTVQTAGFFGDEIAHPFNFYDNIATANSQGVDVSAITSGKSAYPVQPSAVGGGYRTAISLLANKDEYDFNLLFIPGIVDQVGTGHNAIAGAAIEMCQDRGDAFLVLDNTSKTSTVAAAKTNAEVRNSSYAASYYPWVQIQDATLGTYRYVPPSVVMAGVYHFNDTIGQPWFAPAGLNRGGIDSAVQAYRKLTQSNRDDLYDSNQNPIATFPGQGVTVFGQKTLQKKASALDRVNVRRLLINIKKFVASSSRNLVFEQNTSDLRNQFLNIVNPFLEQVQSNSGLNAFRVVMDDSNNTPDTIDRNMLVGQVFLQPSRTAEFIVLDFVVQPTGAAFPE